jgi:hypothetical protein
VKRLHGQEEGREEEEEVARPCGGHPGSMEEVRPSMAKKKKAAKKKKK